MTEIGYDGKTGNTAWEKLHRLAIGNLIITALGFVPGQIPHPHALLMHEPKINLDLFHSGYYVTVVTIEYIGRKKLQFFGFLMEALFRELNVQEARCQTRSNMHSRASWDTGWKVL